MKNIINHKSANDFLQNMRHSCEHVFTQAMINLYGKDKIIMAMGPATEEGFYFDFALPSDIKISEKDFPLIENEMKKIIDKNLPFIRQELPVKKARELFAHNKYKKEWLNEIEKKGEKAVVYYTGEDFVDLCSGPHIENTGKIGPFKLLSIAGAYWRGDERNIMLTRIYGTCFSTQKELDKFLWQKKEAEKRDHRILGKKLDLFVIDENIGKGLPLLTPKGATIRKQILDYEYKLEQKYGFEHVITPHIARSELYKKTGHWQHYKDVMYESFGIEGDEYVLKPMNCPHHYMIYQSRPRSYRDLPMRIAEPGTCYRFEKTGELSGLIRVRALTIDDSHILMSDEQIEDEFRKCIEMVNEMFRVFGLKDFYVRLSLPDPSDAIKYIADEKTWKTAKNLLEKIVKDNKLKYKISEGEASFYGPKLDYIVKDSIGREWQMSTLQLDLFMGKRLNLTYIDKNGKEKHPVILHRGLTGSLERTLAILIEHYAGAFPLWLSPVQVKIIPIAERHIDYAKKILSFFSDFNLRTEIDTRNESMQAKVRDATLQKIPYMGIIGDKETTQGEIPSSDLIGVERTDSQPKFFISVRTREGKDLGKITLSQFLDLLKTKIEKKN